VQRRIAGRCVGWDRFEGASYRLHTELHRFAIPHYYDQLIAVAGVFTDYIATFVYLYFSVDTVKFNVSSSGWFYLHLDFEAACAGSLRLQGWSGA
jgi:hypothetical protein